MDYEDYRYLLEQADRILDDGCFYEDDEIEKEAQYLNEERKALKWLCECSNGHHFDYRNRTRYPESDKTHAPCQGKCPICGSSQISMWSKMLYPIRWNFIGGLYG